MQELLKNLAAKIALFLDGLKIQSPYVFLLIQVSLAGVVKLFVDNKVNVPTPPFILDVFDFLSIPGIVDLDSLIIFFLGSLVVLISPRTRDLAAKARALKAKKFKKAEDEKK